MPGTCCRGDGEADTMLAFKGLLDRHTNMQGMDYVQGDIGVSLGIT